MNVAQRIDLKSSHVQWQMLTILTVAISMWQIIWVSNHVVYLKLIYVNYTLKWRRQWQPTPVLLPGKFHGWRSLVGCSPWGHKELDMTKQLHFHFSLSNFTFTFHFHALEKEMATHSSVLAWKIPVTEEPGRLPSMGSHKVRHDWRDLAAAAAVLHLGLNQFWVYFCVWC